MSSEFQKTFSFSWAFARPIAYKRRWLEATYRRRLWRFILIASKSRCCAKIQSLTLVHCSCIDHLRNSKEFDQENVRWPKLWHFNFDQKSINMLCKSDLSFQSSIAISTVRFLQIFLFYANYFGWQKDKFAN